MSCSMDEASIRMGSCCRPQVTGFPGEGHLDRRRFGAMLGGLTRCQRRRDKCKVEIGGGLAVKSVSAARSVARVGYESSHFRSSGADGRPKDENRNNKVASRPDGFTCGLFRFQK